jgi:hypothetical protein
VRAAFIIDEVAADQLGFLAVMGRQPLGNNFGSTRMAMAIMILAAVALLTPKAAEAEREADAASGV